jgi:EmrB/QacA subfamily drug resistance transporter
MAVLDSTMVNIVLPTITTHFKVSIALSQWTITGYLLAMTGLFIFFGKLSEYTGKVKLFIAGWAIFTVSSLACGFAPGLYELIAFRIVQGIGASMLSAVGGALIFEAFPHEERGKAMGLYGVVFGIAAVVGPGLGGFMIDHMGWQYIFLINVPIGVVLLACAFKYMKIPEATTGRLEMDWPGALTLCIAIVAMMLFCNEVANGLTVTTPMVAYAAISVLAFTIFLFQEITCRKPLLDLSIFRNPAFLLPLVSGILLFTPIAVANTLSPFYFERVMGYSAEQVGYISMVVPLFMMFSAPLTGTFYDKHHWKFTAGTGALVYFLGFLVFGYGLLTVNFGVILAAFVVRGIGGGIFSSPNTIEMMGAVAREKIAIASSVSATANFMAMMLGVALSCTFLTLDLNASGYNGPIFQAGSSMLANAIGVITIGAGFLLIASAAAAVLRNTVFAARPAPPQQKETGV